MDIVHYIITGAIIIIVIYFQLRYYFKSTERIKILSNIFPKEIRVHLYDYCEIEHDSESGQLTGIKTKHKKFYKKFSNIQTAMFFKFLKLLRKGKCFKHQ